MKSLVALLIFVVVVLIIVSIMLSQSRPQMYPLLHSSLPTQGDEAKAYQLLSPCPLAPRNVPMRPERTA